MKLSSTIFYFDDGKNGIHMVLFQDGTITVKICGDAEPKTVPNPLLKYGGRTYKPCVTHAKELLKRALRKPLAGNGARQRANATKSSRPKLFKS